MTAQGSLWLVAEHFVDATKWLRAVVIFRSPEMNSDWSLTPLVLVAFILVVIYMMAFVVFGFVVWPITRLVSYLCELLGEKRNSPFFELGVTISIVVAVVKAVEKLLQWGTCSFN